MKILQVMAGAPHGGAEAAFVDISSALFEAGSDIEVVVRPYDQHVIPLKKAGVPIHTLPFGGPLDIYTPFMLKKIIQKTKPAIVQTWMSRASLKTPAWSENMGIPRYVIASRLGGYYKLKNFKKTDYFIGNTPKLAEYVVESGVPKDRAVYLNNFAPLEKAVKAVDRAAHNTPEDVPLLLALGRLHEVKALDILIQSMTDIPEAYLWIAGEGPLRSELESLAKKLGVSDRIRFLGWRNDRAALFKAADICVFPSRFEPFGNVFVQAWSQKTPLVTTAVQGPLTFAKSEEDCLIVPVDDAKALAEATNRLISDPEFAKQLAKQGFLRFQEEFTKEIVVKRYQDFYNKIAPTA